MARVDGLSGIAARRFAGTDVTTAAVENIRFLKPIPLGAFVDVTAEVVGVGRTSMKVRVRTMMDGETGEDDMLVAEAVFIYFTLNKEIISDRADQLQ